MPHKNKNKNNNKSTVRRVMNPRRTLTWSVTSDGIPQSSLPFSRQEYRFSRSLALSTILTTSTGASSFGSLAFSLSLLPTYSDFTSLFDQYRIDEIEVWLYPSPGSTVTTNSMLANRYISVTDVDDSTDLSTIQQGLEYPDNLCTTLIGGHYRRFKPGVAMAAYNGTFTGYANQLSPWIDVASSGVLHYGVKIAAEATQVATVILGHARYHMTFRNVR